MGTYTLAISADTWEAIEAFQRGLDDGFMGDWPAPPKEWSIRQRMLYERGFSHGDWLFKQVQCQSWSRMRRDERRGDESSHTSV